MTDRIHSLTVVLDHNIRSDDIEPIIEAIKLLRCVQEVVPHVADHTAYMAESRAKQMWVEALWKFLTVCRDNKKFHKLMVLLEQLKAEE